MCDHTRIKLRLVTRTWTRKDGTEVTRVYSQKYCGDCHVRRTVEYKRRKNKLNRLRDEWDHWMCTECGAKDRQLHAHHKYYMESRNPWDYPDDAIVTLCEDCHYLEHAPIINPGSRPVKHIRNVMLDLIKSLQNG